MMTAPAHGRQYAPGTCSNGLTTIESICHSGHPAMAKYTSMYELMEVRGVKVFAHWSVLLIGAAISLAALEDPLPSIAVLVSYYAVILIHECGHLILAQRKGCKVWSVELYPLWGITCFSEPYSRFDRCAIAWGGVIAQAIVAVPIVIWLQTFGYSHSRAANAVLAILGFFSLSVAAFNLLPFWPLDGLMAWQIVPALFRRSGPRLVKRRF